MDGRAERPALRRWAWNAARVILPALVLAIYGAPLVLGKVPFVEGERLIPILRSRWLFERP